MVLQPLLENAFKHGVERSTAVVAVTIAAARRGEHLEVTIRNEGSMQDPVPDGGIGLRNCRERLALLHGDQAKLSLSTEGGEVVARLALPFETNPP
jgi:LytS/YehU family sensor histidine kinase